MGWLLVLIVLSSTVMQAGNSIRAERLGGESTYARNATEFVSTTLTRSQGTTRLAEVIQHFGPLSLTNNLFIATLAARGLSATQYIDRTIYGVEIGQSHSVGTSGPGGVYVGLGLAGVFFSYLLARRVLQKLLPGAVIR